MNFYIALASKFPIYLLLVLSATCVVFGDYFAKRWSIDQKAVYFLLTLAGYFSASFFYLPTLLREGLVITSVIWVLFSTIGFLFVGIVIFKETLSPLQVTGVILGIIALILLTLPAYK